MKKYFTVAASFMIMLCIGSIYAWSIVASELIEDHGFSVAQSQLIFGFLVAIFPVTMIFVGRLGERLNHRYLGYISGILFTAGYVLASYSNGSFLPIFLGIGLLAGIATGFGYWVALTAPVQWFPNKKGLITGIAAGGFGLGAVAMSELSEIFLSLGYPMLEVLRIVGVTYGILIFFFSILTYQFPSVSGRAHDGPEIPNLLRSRVFKRLFLGIFLGTFAGLLVIGSLRMIGAQFGFSSDLLVHSIALFAVANFTGRVGWGYISDRIGANKGLFLALLVQAAAILSLNFSGLSSVFYLFLTFLIGLGFGGNFVLFAKETAQVFGVQKLGLIYPYVFIGYAIAGIAGPLSGGYLYDFSGSFFYPVLLAGVVSLMGSLLFLKQSIASRSAI